MQQKSAKELADRQAHSTLLILVGRVAPPKGHACGIQRDQSVVGNGDSMRVAAEIAQDLPGTAKRPLAVDHPFFTEGLSQQFGNHLDASEWFELTVERKSACIERLTETFDHLRAEDLLQHGNGQKEPWR